MADKFMYNYIINYVTLMLVNLQILGIKSYNCFNFNIDVHPRVGAKGCVPPKNFEIPHFITQKIFKNKLDYPL